MYKTVFYLIPLTIFSIFIGNLISKKFNIIDLPGKRKIHKSPIPLSGGISFAFLFNITIIIFLFQNSEFTYFLVTIFICLNIFFLMGLLDDYIDLNYKIRVFISILVYLFFISTSVLHSTITIENLFIDFFFLENFGFLFKLNFLHSIMFTIFCLLFFQFSTNMLDGINGLCLSYLFFINILFFSFNLDITVIKFLNILLIIFVIIFFFFNMNGKSFLGDSGVYSLSFMTGVIILFHYKTRYIDFFDLIIITLIPSLDLLRLFIRRIIAKKNPFSADKNHLHHRLLEKIGFIKTLIFYEFFFLISTIVVYSNYQNKLIYILTIIFTYVLTIYLTKNKLKN
jgi:UDP-GlcNAc:undecaprenyl-phosphate GlcNAc-1-phosphate transferase